MAKTMHLDELLSWVDVDVKTGEIFWLRGKRAGKRAGGKNSQGYWVVNIQYVHYRAHHIVWKVAMGYWPEEIDHIDGDRTNNQLANLREVTRAENLRNQGVPLGHKTGVLGVSLIEKSRKWKARICFGRREINLGHFNTFEEAVAARRRAERQIGFHPNHGQREATCGI